MWKRLTKFWSVLLLGLVLSAASCSPPSPFNDFLERNRQDVPTVFYREGLKQESLRLHQRVWFEEVRQCYARNTNIALEDIRHYRDFTYWEFDRLIIFYQMTQETAFYQEPLGLWLSTGHILIQRGLQDEEWIYKHEFLHHVSQLINSDPKFTELLRLCG